MLTEANTCLSSADFSINLTDLFREGRFPAYLRNSQALKITKNRLRGSSLTAKVSSNFNPCYWARGRTLNSLENNSRVSNSKEKEAIFKNSKNKETKPH